MDLENLRTDGFVLTWQGLLMACFACEKLVSNCSITKK